ncbi:hypothetical protein [Marinobacterium jannaschii]|nr:hypothetical protein [Marinobacterium jannaschii]
MSSDKNKNEDQLVTEETEFQFSEAEREEAQRLTIKIMLDETVLDDD